MEAEHSHENKKKQRSCLKKKSLSLSLKALQLSKVMVKSPIPHAQEPSRPLE